MFYSRSREKLAFAFSAFVFVILISAASGENGTTVQPNTTCKKIQSSEFPEDLFTTGQRKCGAIILHIVFAIHCFGAIALVCSERFLPTISCICQDLKLSDDVAAATFMSLATSAPELFSNIIGTFITESDIGIGHVIGNGYYNMLFVAALGGVVAKKGIVLEWWPLARDCVIYTFVAVMLTGIVWDGVVQMHEAIILLILYFLYFIVMFNNKRIVRVLFRKFDAKIQNIPQTLDLSGIFSQNLLPVFAPKLDERGKKGHMTFLEQEALTKPSSPDDFVVEVNTRATTNEKEEANEKGNLEEIEPLDSDHDFTLRPQQTSPTDAGETSRWDRTKKILTTPVTFLIRYTIPDVRATKYRKYYPVAFVMCVLWIGVSTYLGTWMVSVIGETFGVPDLVMGMVFMAAGGSVVEAYAVYYKAKRGECSIGLSNSIGCNTLDVTLCLSLPWFIKTLPIKTFGCENESFDVILESSLIHINCLLLVLSVVAVFVIFFLNTFKLDRKLGLICGGMYILVLFIGISVETYSNND